MVLPPPEIPPELRTLMSEIGTRWSVNRPQNIETMIERFQRRAATVSARRH